MRYIALFFVLWSISLPAFSEGQPIMRREGFLLIWESIRRPAEETQEMPFEDVQEFDEGFMEITYAKARGLLDDVSRFHPNDPLILDDALLWLYRTRNVAGLSDMEREGLPALHDRYPVANAAALGQGTTIGRGELLSLVQSLDARLLDEVHEASFYADDFHGNGTAFGETFDMNALTAAHRTFPHNTLVKVTNIENGESVTVRINDRGPYVDGRDIDLSLAAFTSIAARSRGKIMARFERLGDVSLVDRCAPYGHRYQQRITRDVRFRRGVPHTFTLGNELILKANRYFVVRGVTYPDGNFIRMQDFVSPDEKFSFAPSAEGIYRFLVGTKEGRVREMRMRVVECS